MQASKEYRRIAVFGGIYNNAMALEATLEDAYKREVEAVFCLGDMGGWAQGAPPALHRQQRKL